MADDTRLAEASLLLNYSVQSYKEQQLTRSQQNQQVRVKIEPDSDRSIETSTRQSQPPITPPPDREPQLPAKNAMIDNNPLRTNSITDHIDCQRQETNFKNISPAQQQQSHHQPLDEATANELDISMQVLNKPLSDLLAAVNCAMPKAKSRPNILQKPNQNSMQRTDSNDCPSRSQMDHNYCLQYQQDKCPSIDTNGTDVSNQIVADYDDENKCNSNCYNRQYIRHVNPAQNKIVSPSPIGHCLQPKKKLKLIAIHLGAGNSRDDEAAKSLARRLCEEVMLGDNNNQATASSDSNLRRKLKDCCINEGREVDYGIGSYVSAETAVVRLIEKMENHDSLNCGHGSNLNFRGQVECDASLMSDRTEAWSGVGAIYGCKNPIALAKSLYDHRSVPRPLGLIQPNLLVGSGAKQWMRDHCPHLSIIDSRMISSIALSSYQKFKSRYDAAERAMARSKKSSAKHTKESDEETLLSLNGNLPASNEQTPYSLTFDQQRNIQRSPTFLDHGFYCIATGRRLRESVELNKHYQTKSFSTMISDTQGVDNDGSAFEQLKYDECDRDLDDISTSLNQENLHSRLDTVGAVAVDGDNNFACAISSGGLLLKYRGRLGQAAVPGAGCWAEDSVAVTTTGVGEYLTVTMFAKRFFDKMNTLRLLYDLGHVKRTADSSNLISGVMDDCFVDLFRSPALGHVPAHERLAGMLSVSSLNSKSSSTSSSSSSSWINGNNDLYLSFAHNTRTMCIGYMTCNDTSATSIMSRNQSNDGSVQVRTIRFYAD